MWNLVLVYLETLLVSVQDRCTVLVRLEKMLILMQDRCMVCAKCIIGSEIGLDAPNGTPR